MVPYHMIGADNVASKLLGGYVEHLSRLHPDKPPAGIYRSDSIVNNARHLRDQMGNEGFFRSLNSFAAGGDGGWGAFEARWDPTAFEAACRATDPLDSDRVQLVSDLVATLLPSAKQTAGVVDLDEGLSILTSHAKSLGYDGVVLFIDELILWLATKAADVKFVTEEAPKLVKLVEAGGKRREVPIISFVARQRDLRSVIGEQAAGAEVRNFEEALNHFEQRFETIPLEDKNLAAIAERTVRLDVALMKRQFQVN